MNLGATLTADLAANRTTMGRLAVRLLRLSQRLPRPAGKLVTLAMMVLCGAEIPAAVKIGPGVRLPHGGRGVVIHPGVVIGSGVTIYHGVTIGVSGPIEVTPVLEDDVYLGTGAVVLGGIRLGQGCVVGANAVVTRDVPAGATVVGNPARLVERAG